MRLINTSTGLLEEFLGRNIPKYAILSHRWEEEEVSIEDMRDPSRYTKKGWQKIQKTLEIAFQAGLDYAWVDTCCINKSSSAELAEAINSMYRWYQRSEICYAFLSDLPAFESLDVALKQCQWFTRGWTLQELIAPENVIFFDRGWNLRGSKVDLIKPLSMITGINPAVLRHEKSLASVAVAQKMSWAAHRETTRIEDTAYCLLGIFDVHMALLYGEEGKAFRRLQEEIIKSTADLSIFAWRMPLASKPAKRPKRRHFCSVLAESPLPFANSISFEKIRNHGLHEFSISNKGVKTKARILSEEIPGEQRYRYVLSLESFRSTTPKQVLGIRLRMCGDDQYMREDPWNLVKSTIRLQRFPPRESYLLTKLPEMNLHPTSQILDTSQFIAQTRSHVLQIIFPRNVGIVEASPWGRYDDEDQIFDVSGDSKLDVSAMKLNIIYELKYRRKAKIEFHCMFYAVGWSALDAEPQSTLVNYQSLSTNLKNVQTEIATWDPTSSQVADLLRYHQIPRSPAATYEIPGTEESIFVSFTTTLESDPKVCPNRFWRIKFISEICETRNLLPVEHSTWIPK
jgi:hypothetical protein